MVVVLGALLAFLAVLLEALLEALLEDGACGVAWVGWLLACVFRACLPSGLRV